MPTPSFRNVDSGDSYLANGGEDTKGGIGSGQYAGDSEYAFLKGLTPEQWAQLSNGDKQDFAAFMNAHEKGLGTTPMYREDMMRRISGFRNKIGAISQQNDARSAEQDKADAILAQRQGVTNQLQKYYDMLSAPVINPDGTTSDPLAKQLIASGQNVAQGEAAQRGIGGPMAGTAAMQSAQSALQPYLAQRQALAGQALSVINNRDMGLEDQRLKADQLGLEATQMNNDASASAYNANMKQGQGIGSAIGTAVGALGFIGGPALGAATMAAGGAFGGGVGGMIAGGGSGPTLSRPRFGNSSGGSSGRGNF